MEGAATIGAGAPANVTATAWICPKLAFELMEARGSGDMLQAEKLEYELEFDTCDVKWAESTSKLSLMLGIPSNTDKK